MNFKKYRFIVLYTTIAILGTGIFMMNYGDIASLSAKIGTTIKHVFVVQSANINNSPANIQILIPIERILSKRYLYTLTKYIEADLTIRIGTGVKLESTYNTYGQVSLSGSNFTFTINATTVEIPASMYFFDTWNRVSKNTISGEGYEGAKAKVTGAPTKVIALTFDDGPSIKYTNTLLDMLKKEQVKVTFYVLGSRVDQYPGILKREYAEGHEIGNHSYSHAFLARISETMMQEELYKTDQAIYHAIGVYPNTFRPPYGEINTGMLQKSAMPAILWSIDSRDWKTRNITKNIRAVANAHDGDIVIFHDIHKTSVDSIPDIIKNLKNRGFTFVTVSELLSISAKNTEIGKECTKKGSCK